MIKEKILKKELLCTLGPASFNKKIIYRLQDLGVNLFRINLSHTKIEELSERIHFIRKYSDVPICLDTEGAQIRTGNLPASELLLKVNQELTIGLLKDNELIDNIPLYPHFAPSLLKEGDLLSVDFDSAIIQVTSIKHEKVTARVISSGLVCSNKAVTALRTIDLPSVTEKDREAVKIGIKLGIKHFALSFANSRQDVESFRELTKARAYIISKIECKNGYRNLKEILQVTDAILIDRGDLSREIQIELVPFYQEKIIKESNKAKKPVYIATNILESMVEKPYPTRAEVNDVIYALMNGADGLVLAAETAIGKRPIESASMVIKLINQYYLSNEMDLTKNQNHVCSLLVEPHGGKLIQRLNKNPDWQEIAKLKRLKVSDSVIMDVEQICVGTYSPLQGFMTEEQIHSTLESNMLPGEDKTVWTLPIVLQKHSHEITDLKKGEIIALENELDNEIYATLSIDDIYKFPFDEICFKWFGTLSKEHPGVQRLQTDGDYFLGGKVTLFKKRKCSHRIYSFTPLEFRHIFNSKGWSKVVAFHTRNVVHCGHEAILSMALEKTHCDGLLISPVIGEKKSGDFTSEVLLNGYQTMLNNNFLSPDRTFLAAFSTFSRYSGAREAVFTALCRKNFGCSHFIIGRDHTGVGNFYKPTASQELFKELGNIGIEPVIFDEIKFCSVCGTYLNECEHKTLDQYSLSGSLARNYLTKGEKPPSWLMREEISNMVLEYLDQGKDIFV